jgi:hypothetical protein
MKNTFSRGARFYKAEIMCRVPDLPNVTVLKCGTSGMWYVAVILKNLKTKMDFKNGVYAAHGV